MSTDRSIGLPPHLEDLKNRTFGRRLVLDYAGSTRTGTSTWHGWYCLCSCGIVDLVRHASLLNGLADKCQPCGRQDRKHGMTYSVEYHIWRGMRSRCEYKLHKAWNRYGGRGISVCERWKVFLNFYSDMGPRPSPRHSLDRFPNKDGNYEPGNVRWATAKEQMRNTMNNVMVTHNGETKCVAEWAEITGLNSTTIHMRVRAGWPAEAILLGEVSHCKLSTRLHLAGTDESGIRR